MLLRSLLVLAPVLLPCSLAAEMRKPLDARYRKKWEARLTTLRETQVNPVAEIPRVESDVGPWLAPMFEAQVHLRSDGSMAAADLFEQAQALVANGFATQPVDDAMRFLDSVEAGQSNQCSMSNDNPPIASPGRKSWFDRIANRRRYRIDEEQLRRAIHIPSTFQFGQGPQPVILIPGMGNLGCTNYGDNLIKLLQGPDSAHGDPVWLNIPGFMLDDMQDAAEYIAYAISYVYEICNHRKVTTVAWTSGNLAMQWANTFYPATVDMVAGHVALAPKYEPAMKLHAQLWEPLPPAMVQQMKSKEGSEFWPALTRHHGKAPRVPTTNVYLQRYDYFSPPCDGSVVSAEEITDRNGVGMTNVAIDDFCRDEVGGRFYTTEGVPYSSVARHVLIDALKHGGAVDPGRIDRNEACAHYAAQGLDMENLRTTENALLYLVLNMIRNPNKSAIAPYVRNFAEGKD